MSEPRTELDYEIERLKAEIQQERQMKEMLEQSSVELEKTIGELQERYDGVDEEENEWKTRFETQQEMNSQLEKQIIMLRDKLEKLQIPPQNGKQINHLKTFSTLSDAEIKRFMKQLERDKISLQGQLRDLEWRLDNESKAYYNIDEERKRYLTELNQATAVIDDSRPKATKIRGQNTFGLPDNQRIIDPKKGPIKKVAAVRKLPKLPSSGSDDTQPDSN